MKINILLMTVLLGAGVLTANAQADLRKKIEVTGTAERTLLPDQIFLNITLKEYKNGSRIVEMDRLEEELVKSLKKLDIPQDKLTVYNIYGFNWDWRKKRPDDFLASKTFQLELSNLKMINDLIENLTPEGVERIQIAEVRHTREDEIMEELAQEALVSAREKANRLLNAIDEELGGVLEVYQNNITPGYQQMRMMNAEMKSDGYSSDLDFRNIELKTEVRAIFEIK